MSNELYHYGVLGMKWGIHKARKNGVEYSYKSMGQKKYEKKIAKLKERGKTAKAEQATYTLNQLKNRDKNREEYARSTTVGKTIAKGLLLGPFGSGNYNRMRAAGSGRAAAFLKSNIISSTLGLPVQLIMTRDEEFKSSRRH